MTNRLQQLTATTEKKVFLEMFMKYIEILFLRVVLARSQHFSSSYSSSGCGFLECSSYSEIFMLKYSFDSQESEITEMRQTIELLRKQSIQAGLTSAHMQSMGVQVNVNGAKTNGSPTKPPSNGAQNGQNGNMERHHSNDSMCSINSNGSNGSSQDKKKKKGWVSDN